MLCNHTNSTVMKMTLTNFCVDINECNEETDGCAQNCTNTNGSYTCSCNTGYRLGSDGYSCYGTSNYPSDLGCIGLINHRY